MSQESSSSSAISENYIEDLAVKNAPVAFIGVCPSTKFIDYVKDENDDAKYMFFNGQKDMFWSYAGQYWFDNTEMTPRNAKHLYDEQDWAFLYVLNEPFESVKEATAEKDEFNEGLEKIKRYIHTCTPSLVVFTGKQIPLYLFGRDHCQNGIKTYDMLPKSVKSWVDPDTAFFIMPTTVSGTPAYLKGKIEASFAEASLYIKQYILE